LDQFYNWNHLYHLMDV